MMILMQIVLASVIFMGLFGAIGARKQTSCYGYCGDQGNLSGI